MPGEKKNNLKTQHNISEVVTNRFICSSLGQKLLEESDSYINFNAMHYRHSFRMLQRQSNIDVTQQS